MKAFYTFILATLIGAAAAMADTQHKVVKGESISGIAYKYKISVEELVRRNPQANAGVRVGMILNIPDGNSAPTTTAPTSNSQNATVQPVATQTAPVVTESEPVNTVIEIVEEPQTSNSYQQGNDNPYLQGNDNPYLQSNDNPYLQSGDTDLNVDVLAFGQQEPRFNFMVMLPFTSGPEKKAKQYAEFYRGMLLAAKELTRDNGPRVEIYAKNIEPNAQSIEQQLQGAVESGVSVIIAPEDPALMRRIISYAEPRGIYVLNMFNIKDESHLTMPYVLQGYIDAQLMYDKAVTSMLDLYPGFTPVILSPSEGKAEKEPFVQALRKKYASLGLEVKDLPYTESLQKSDFEAAGIVTDGTQRYVFVPKSGAVSVFNSFAPSIAELRAADPGAMSFALFGYPDWTAFRGEHLTMLYDIQASVYSRFFFNEKSVEARALRNGYERWYGENMLEAVPNQAALGYDTATMLVQWLQQSQGQFGMMLGGSHLARGIQSSFSFTSAGPDAGYVNSTLYIVNFLPDRTCESIVY